MGEVTEDMNAGKLKKTVLSSLAGAAVGAGSVTVLIWLAGDSLLDAMSPSRAILALVGLVYLLMTAMMAFGLVAPRAGAKLLNVDDAEELVDDQPKLIRSIFYMTVVGLALILLALARGPGFPEGVVAPGVGLGAVVALLLASLWSFGWMRYYDELDLQMGVEGGAWAFLIACGVLIPWAALDALGWGVSLTSIDVVTVLAVSLLLGCFVAIGKRGMMVR